MHIVYRLQSFSFARCIPFVQHLAILLSFLSILGCGSSNSSSGALSSSTYSGTNPTGNNQSLSAKERLTSFGFSQEVLINKLTATARADLALSMPAKSSRSTAINYFSPNAAIGNVAVGYTIVPHTIDVTNRPSGGYLSTVGNLNDYLTAALTAPIDSSDLSSIFRNNTYCPFLNLGQQSTKDKMTSVLNQILKDVPTASGFFVDHIEPSANLPEEYWVKTGFDHVPADIFNFYKNYPQAVIIVNTIVNDPANPTTNEQLRAREAVTIAALVSGLHAIDRGSSDHGDNDYARQFLNFPILRPGKPASALVDTTGYNRRDYAGMVAIIAKQNATTVLPSGTWHEYWDNSGQGAPLSGSLN